MYVITIDVTQSSSNTCSLELLMCSLELLDLLEKTDQVTDWYMLGVYLKIPHSILDDIEKRLSTHGVKQCKTEMFVLWKRRTPGAYWEQCKSR